MEKDNCYAVCEEETEFVPTAKVRDLKRLWRRSSNLDKMIGQDVVIDPNTEHVFKIQGQERKSFVVTTKDKKNSYQICTNFLVTMCKKTHERFGITLIE